MLNKFVKVAAINQIFSSCADKEEAALQSWHIYRKEHTIMTSLSALVFVAWLSAWASSHTLSLKQFAARSVAAGTLHRRSRWSVCRKRNKPGIVRGRVQMFTVTSLARARVSSTAAGAWLTLFELKWVRSVITTSL